MTAVQIHEFGGPEVLKTEQIPEPVEKDNEVGFYLRALRKF